MWLWGLIVTATVAMASTELPDFDGDGTVGFSDFVIFAGKYGLSEGDDGYDARYDLNRDGAIGFSDLLIFAENFGKEAPSPVVTIPDANLRWAIAGALGKAGDAPVTVADMKTLTELSAPGKGISDLNGLESAVNLALLNLGDNEITDLSPLAGLTNLTTLYLSGNEITDLSPLSGLISLEFLRLYSNRIRNISVLAGLTNLTVLNLGGNLFTDLSPLSGLTSLRDLDLDTGRHYITDVSPLAGLTSLTKLNLTYTAVADISALAGLTSLRELYIGTTRISDLSLVWGMTHLEGLGLGNFHLGDMGIAILSRFTRLRRLSLWDNEITDISVLSGLTNLENLSLGLNNISDLSPLSGLPHLTSLSLSENDISDLSPLSGLTTLKYLDLRLNNISDLSPLSGLAHLRTLLLSSNNISDLSPLVGITSLRWVYIEENPLNAASIGTHVPALQARGGEVRYSEFIVFTEPTIYNDNVFVLPLEEDLVSGLDVPLEDYASRFYQQMSDAFDFLIFFADRKQFPRSLQGGFHRSVTNDVQGIGSSAYFDNRFGSAGKLQSVLGMSEHENSPLYSDFGHTALIRGPMLHELMHRWANRIVPMPGNIRAHWGFSSANGILGGFDIATLEDYGGGRYGAADVNAPPGWDSIAPYGWAGNLKPYSPIELYLAGLIPPEEVPDLWVAEDGAVGDHEARDRVPFVGNRVKTYTIEDFIAKHGPRVPNHTQSQKAFRAAVILLIIRDRADALVLETLSDDVSLFSHAGEDQSKWVNFYEATGGRATIAMDGLSQFQSRASAKRVIPRSYGTPPPPIVCHGE